MTALYRLFVPTAISLPKIITSSYQYLLTETKYQTYIVTKQ